MEKQSINLTLVVVLCIIAALVALVAGIYIFNKFQKSVEDRRIDEENREIHETLCRMDPNREGCSL